MKKILFFILALAGGILGSYLFSLQDEVFGATTARTTVTNPWTFAATTTTANITATTADTATSTLQVGCIQGVATSTATPIRFEISTSTANATYNGGIAPNGVVAWRYGKCPKI